MTKDEALNMAIEALETAEIQSEYDGLSNLIFKAIQACKEALEQPSWQKLSDDEIKFLCDVVIETQSNDVIEYEWHEMQKIARAIEQALKEKNNAVQSKL